MSKDIRSFFSVKKPNNVQQNRSSGSVSMVNQLVGKKKRAFVISDSDSEEETRPVKTKRSKPSVDVSGKKQNSHKKPKEVPETKSKYFECPNVSVEDIFGDAPVKRDTSRKIIKKVVTKEEKESHFDKDFEAELLKLDDTWSEIVSKEGEAKANEENFMKGVKMSPKKTGSEVVNNNNRRSPRKKKSDLDCDESPRKKLKSENKEDSCSTRRDKKKEGNNKHSTLSSYKNESPRKSTRSKISSPEKSPFKDSPLNKSPIKNNVSNTPEKSVFKNESPKKSTWSKISSPEKIPFKDSPLNKSPIKNNVLKTPEKSPFNKLSLTRTKKESFKNEDSTDLNDLISSKDSDISKTERTKKEANLKKSFAEKSSPNNINDRFEKKKDPTVDELKDRTYKKKDPSPSLSTATKEVATISSPSSLWVERYKPTGTKQIIGQQGEKSCVNKLITWLKQWEKNHSGTKKLVKPSPWAKNDDGAFFKAALLSGPPGVGKTTTAHLVCKELEFDVVEFNASDTRSKKLLHQEVSELLSTNSLSPFFTGKGDQVTKKHVLLMDEVDGMAGNEDRGGVQELITLIKQSRIPVICMCNDRNHPKIRSLANYCFDLRFSKPRVEQIKGAMMSVCFKEKLKLKPDELTDIITSANQDIRLIMNHLSMLSMEKTSMANSTKHIKLGPWDIVRKIFSEQEHKSMSIYDKCDLFFHDYSVTPLFVQENYLNAVPHKPEAKNKIKKIELFAKAAKSLSFGDLTEKAIRSNNAWGLLPVQAVFSSLVPGDVLEGHLGGQINFPAWFGKNSRQTKMSRLVQELTVHSRMKISGNREAMNLDYLSSLEKAITMPLSRDGVDGVTATLAVLTEYCLVREDMDSIAELSSWPGSKNRFAEVDSKVKAAFTRAYNKTSVPTPYAAVHVKKGRGDIDNSEGLGEEEETGTQDMEEEEEEGLDADAMIMVKKKPAGKKADKDAQPMTSKGSKTSKRGRKK